MPLIEFPFILAVESEVVNLFEFRDLLGHSGVVAGRRHDLLGGSAGRSEKSFWVGVRG
jgi:hypothetical protein